SNREQRSEIRDQRSETPSTLPAFCLDALAKHNKPDAVSEKRDHEWAHVSAQDFIQRVRHIALGLKDLGIEPGDRIALISENRPDWSIADLAILSVGAVTAPFYSTQAIYQIQFILCYVGSRCLLISGGTVREHGRAGA